MNTDLRMQQFRFVGLAGFATVGKDLFFSILDKEYPSVRFSLADALKLEIRPTLLEESGVDILTCGAEEKEELRPRLVSYGKEKRKESNGRHWIDLLDGIIKNTSTLSKIPVITDIRYAEYENDEVDWVKDELGGVLVYIKKYKIIGKNKKYIGAPNEEEAQNDPILRKRADYVVEWEVAEGDFYERCDTLTPHIKKFIDWYGKVL